MAVCQRTACLISASDVPPLFDGVDGACERRMSRICPKIDQISFSWLNLMQWF
jgi:hypothetical protein